MTKKIDPRSYSDDGRLEMMSEYVAKLEAALKPFADVDLTPYQYADDRLLLFHVPLTIGDFRRAHDVLYPPSVK